MKLSTARASTMLLALLCGVTARAGRVETQHLTPEMLQRGHAEGVAVSVTGTLFPARQVTPHGAPPLPGAPAQAFAMAMDPAGNLYLGTGPDGRVLQISPSGTGKELFRTEQPLVTALAVTGDGSILAGTSPGGVVYRVSPTGGGDIWCETGERYIWALAVDDEGRVFAATGERGAVLRLHRSGSPETFFDSDETHIVSLAPTSDGGWIAGGAGRGIVYRIDEEGHGIALHDDDLLEASAVYEDRDGSVVAAWMASDAPDLERPALRLRLPDGVRVGAADPGLRVLDDDDASGPTLRGIIEGLEDTRGARLDSVRGRVLRIHEDGRIDELWTSRTERPYAIAGDGRGTVWFGTGGPAGLYEIPPGGKAARLNERDEGQLNALVASPLGLYLATSNPAAVYRVRESRAEIGVYRSVPIDAGAQARWGALRWAVAGDPGRVELYARTGNSRLPDATWSGWGPLLRDPDGTTVDCPDGRFLQFRARFPGAGIGASRLSGISIDYATYNRAPELRELRPIEARDPTSSDTSRTRTAVAADDRASDTDQATEEASPDPADRSGVTYELAFRDPDGDALDAWIEFRAVGESDWREGPRSSYAASGDAWRAERISLDSTSLPEGRYALRGVVSDQRSNAPNEGRRGEITDPRGLTVDRTPPTMEIRPGASGGLDVELIDAHSPIRGLEVTEGGRTLYTLRPVDGVGDSPRESFRVPAEASRAGFGLRGLDANGNAVERAVDAR